MFRANGFEFVEVTAPAPPSVDDPGAQEDGGFAAGGEAGGGGLVGSGSLLLSAVPYSK